MTANERLKLDETEEIELDLLLEGIFRKYGYDFRSYSRAHVRRRMLNRLALSELESITHILHKALYDEEFFNRVLLDLSINVTEMFRDPPFYKAVRKQVIARLRTYPFIRIWHAGCATGEEVYSMSILFREEGLQGRAQFYATDFNPVVLDKAKSGVYPIESVREYTSNYQEAGGLNSFAEYYTADYDHVKLDTSLRDMVLFSEHNLVTDGVFGEMHLVVCRNVLIYFAKELQNRVMGLFYDSLCPGGILCLGSKESLRFTDYEDKFEPLDMKQRIYRKKML